MDGYITIYSPNPETTENIYGEFERGGYKACATLSPARGKGNFGWHKLVHDKGNIGQFDKLIQFFRTEGYKMEVSKTGELGNIYSPL